MARYRKRETDRIPNAAGLEVTQPEEDEQKIEEAEASIELTEPEADDSPQPEEIQEQPEPESPVMVSSTIPTDPSATPAACLIAVGKLYNDMGIVSAAISGHLPKISAEIELHAMLMRVQGACGEFRHMIDQIEEGLSDYLRDSITSAVA